MIKFFCTHDGKSIRFACNYPNECPMCNSKILPIHLFEDFNADIDLVSIFFKCPSCGKGFISHYKYEITSQIEHNHYQYTFLKYINSFPTLPKTIDFDEHIKKISKDFCRIYNQAFASEIYQLNEIAGIGYRKSLEFLIKDYCIHKNPDKESDIKSKQLSKVISEYVNSEQIKKLATASAWIGNDETHYVRKIENKDITDLKRFITATVAFIAYELTCEDAEELISSK